MGSHLHHALGGQYTVAKARNVEGAMDRLRAVGVSTLKLDRAGAEDHITELLKRPL